MGGLGRQECSPFEGSSLGQHHSSDNPHGPWDMRYHLDIWRQPRARLSCSRVSTPRPGDRQIDIGYDPCHPHGHKDHDCADDQGLRTGSQGTIPRVS